MTIEQRLAEIIQAFHTDALSSAVNLRPRHHALRAHPSLPRRTPKPPARLRHVADQRSRSVNELRPASV
ncbi:hypothetical protein Rhow_001234 [Rhodococcus wratislaviensis]|uniref:Uncharacterized protein n=1 Tax=Rhodococcus wratislaviensis TaxID=44752 RepID=A0A402C3I4_RHOWR|nr:hypothetical protein Rhow_001234 [Rhodococcus wratislaviensis]